MRPTHYKKNKALKIKSIYVDKSLKFPGMAKFLGLKVWISLIDVSRQLTRVAQRLEATIARKKCKDPFCVA